MPENGTLTRRMLRVTEEISAELNYEYSREGVYAELKKLLAAQSDRPAHQVRLCAMLQANGIACESGRENAYYLEAVKAHWAQLPPRDEIAGKIMVSLLRRYGDYPAPADYMKRIVDRLCHEADGWQGDSLRLRILRQFVCYGDCLTQSGYKSEGFLKKWAKAHTGAKPADARQLANALTDAVFSVLELTGFEGYTEAERAAMPEKKRAAIVDQAKKEKRPAGKYGLLKLADDLAAGRFRPEGATRRGLYLFAIVFEMTYYYGAPNTIWRRETDVEKNLFQDYYANNVARFLEDEYGAANLGGYDLDPSGIGINYKNFADVIYLYCIAHHKKPDGTRYTPAEKLCRAAQMMAAVQAAEPLPAGEAEKTTAYYRHALLAGDASPETVFAWEEPAFLQWLRENYPCQTAQNGRVVNPFSLREESASARDAYRALLQRLRRQAGEGGIALPGQTPEEGEAVLMQGLSFVDAGAFGLENTRQTPKQLGELYPGVAADELPRLERLLCRVDGFLSVEPDAAEPKNVTRTNLIAACYVLYQMEEFDEAKSFAEIYADFAALAGSYLEQAGYLPISDKNLLDLLVVFSCYAYHEM